MIKRLLTLLTVLVLLTVSSSAAEEEAEAVTGPVAKTIDDLNAMLDGSPSVTSMIDTPFYENVTDEDTALEAAVQETRIAETEAEDIPDGCFVVCCEVPESLQECSDLLVLSFLDEDWNVVESTWPDARLKRFLYILPAGGYQIALAVPGEDGEGSVMWLMTGDQWVCMDGSSPIPDDTLFTYEEGCVYELPTDGLDN